MTRKKQQEPSDSPLPSMTEMLKRSMPDSVRFPEFHVATNVWIRGDVEATGNGRVEGTVEGAITLAGRLLTVERKGQVLGDVQAARVVVHGRLKGDVTASEEIEISEGAVVEGTVHAPKLVLAEGAVLQGSVAREREPGRPALTDNLLQRSPWSLRAGASRRKRSAARRGSAPLEPLDRP